VTSARGRADHGMRSRGRFLRTVRRSSDSGSRLRHPRDS
jgi:hypothetical protein